MPPLKGTNESVSSSEPNVLTVVCFISTCKVGVVSVFQHVYVHVCVSESESTELTLYVLLQITD